MNIYVLLAIALSAFTGVADVSTSRRGTAEVVSARAVRPEVREVRGEKRVVRASHERRALRTTNIAARPDAPLSGAATPRAPAAA